MCTPKQGGNATIPEPDENNEEGDSWFIISPGSPHGPRPKIPDINYKPNQDQ